MKKLFVAIRQGDADTVTALLDRKPEVTWSHECIHPQETLLLQYITRNGRSRCEKGEGGLS